MVVTRKVLVCVLMTAVCLAVAMGQEPIVPAGGKTPEQQYDELISGALRLQVRADSLARAANVLRRELAFVKDSDKHEMEQQVLRLEKESFTIQQEADYHYSRARVIELKLIAGKNTGGQAASPLNLPDQYALSGEDNAAASVSAEPTFLMLGQYNTSHMLSADDMAMAREFEPEFILANELMQEVAELAEEVDRLMYLLETDPRRRDRRRINQRIDELSTISFEKKMEAMAIYKEINSLRYTAATAFLEEKRGQVTNQGVLERGLAHEELARESFGNAESLHETAIHLRSAKYFEDFTIKAYDGELFALSELEKALAVYEAPPVTRVVVQEVQEEKKEVPLRADGRIDTALALSRSRTAATDDSAARVGRADDGGLVYMDYGFSVLPASPYSEDNPIPSAVKLPHGLVYTIQLGVYNSLMPHANFGGLAPVMTERDPGSRANRYFAGIFKSVHDAEKALIEVNRQGFSDAFLVAYNDGLRIPVNRARQMERGRLQAAAGPDIVAPPPVVVDEKPGIVTFKIQLGAFRELVQPDVHRSWLKIAAGKNIEHTRNINGLYVYSIGNFNTFEEAQNIRDLFINQGISDAFIVPYKGDARISMEEANKLLEQ